LAVVAGGCVLIKDCGGVLGNKTDARIRSSKVRMLLEDPPAAYARFAPYAAMAALVYEEAPDCKHRLPPVEHRELLSATLDQGGWHRDDTVPGLPRCDDDIGTFFRVWTKEHSDHLEVVVVFRGTKGGLQDWVHGNLRWFTRILPGDDQYERSRQHAAKILDHFKTEARRAPTAKPVRFHSAGHSLGGGLAQNVLYRYPEDFTQAYAFDPSPVTGYGDNEPPQKRASCDCRRGELAGEARVYRLYETDEVLAWIRLPLKLVLPLNRHIQEVRLKVDAGHSMAGLARKMIEGAGTSTLGVRTQWWRGRSDDAGGSCTAAFEKELDRSCSKDNRRDYCPR
jgi:pimeloyl-ACP methyl ester carboxylesterase